MHNTDEQPAEPQEAHERRAPTTTHDDLVRALLAERFAPTPDAAAPPAPRLCDVVRNLQCERRQTQQRASAPQIIETPRRTS